MMIEPFSNDFTRSLAEKCVYQLNLLVESFDIADNQIMKLSKMNIVLSTYLKEYVNAKLSETKAYLVDRGYDDEYTENTYTARYNLMQRAVLFELRPLIMDTYLLARMLFYYCTKSSPDGNDIVVYVGESHAIAISSFIMDYLSKSISVVELVDSTNSSKSTKSPKSTVRCVTSVPISPRQKLSHDGILRINGE